MDAARPAPEALPPGTELFGYVIEKAIGRGGMGTVYLAQQQSLHRRVALKVLHPSRIRSPQQIDGFLREARAAGRLNHPHLVLVHAVHDDAERGLYCYSMEYVPGVTLTALLQAKGPLRRQSALHLTYQIAKALGHAHRNGLVHRDVKPDNILVTGNGVAKLADLGLVRDQLEGVSAGSSSRKLTIVGTPAYSAPEQCRNPQRATAASDVYSLGACLFFMLAGKPPFQGETVIDLIVRAATEPVQYPEAVPPDCRPLLDRLLAKDPAQRPADGEAVVAALESLAKGQPLPSPTATPTLPEGDDETESDAEPVDGDPAGAAAPRRRNRVRRRRR